MVLEALWVAYMLDRVLTSRRCLVIMWRIDRAKRSDERLFEQPCPSCVSWSTTWCTRRSGMMAVRGGKPPAPWSAIPRGHQISQGTVAQPGSFSPLCGVLQLQAWPVISRNDQTHGTQNQGRLVSNCICYFLVWNGRTSMSTRDVYAGCRCWAQLLLPYGSGVCYPIPE